MRLFLLILFVFPVINTLTAQSGFRYQAVVRDNSGNVLANQTVNIRFGIIQDNINNTPVYTETHSTLSTPYGVVNVTVGAGTVVTGVFADIDWSKTSFLQIEMDVLGGTNYQAFGTSEILSTPKSLYAETASALTYPFGLNVMDFGAVGDNNTDDYTAFQNALNAAAIKGNRVIVPVGNYKISQTLVIPAGVNLIGEGVGQEPLQTPFNGSAIRYCGTGAAVEISGHTSGIRDMLIYDNNQGSQNADGLHIKADGELVESIRLFNVLLFYFTGGTALKLEAINAGGIPYLTSYNTRIRNAKIGIHITQDASSFVNSNVFHHGAVSGGGFDYCLLVDGGNNNQFYGTIFEPGTSTFGHIFVNTGEIQCHEIRIEGNGQAATKPLVFFANGTRNSNISGTYAGGLTIDNGNNYIGFRSGKAAPFKNTRANLYENATFYGFENGALPYWDITGTAGVTSTIQAPELTTENKVLKLTIPDGSVTNLEPSTFFIPEIGGAPIYEQMNVGMFVKIAHAGIAYIRTNSPNGVTVSQAHPGDGEWHYISMNNLVNTSITLDTKLEINNNTGGEIEAYITAPTFNFGNVSPEITPKPITTAGGILNGTITNGFLEFNNTANFITLPKEGNIFLMTGTTAIHRINDATLDRFPKGTVITLLFDEANVSILDGVFIDTFGAFTSTVGASISLVSLGNGTWRELGRNL